MADNEMAYIGVDPVVIRANPGDQPINTAAEMRKLEDAGMIDKAEDDEINEMKSDEVEDEDESELPAPDSANDGSGEVQLGPIDPDGNNEVVVESVTVEPSADDNELGMPVNEDGSVQVSAPADENNDGLIDPTKL